LRDPSSPRPCPFCSTSTFRRTLVLREKTYLVCALCKTLRLHPASDPAERTRFYQNSYAEHFLSALDHPTRREMLRELLGRLDPPRGRRLLDIGAGSGLLVMLASEAGWQAEGTELSSQFRAWARSEYGIDLRDPRSEPPPPNTYDVVCLVNVLDQAPDPGALLRDVRLALRPRGRFFIRVPNATFHVTWMRSVTRLGIESMAGAAILHEYGFTSTSLRSVLHSMGFHVLTTRNAGLSGATTWMSRLGPFSKPFRFALSSFFGVIAGLTGGRFLWAPSLEAEAEKPADPENARPQAS
jgi:SAM-dependent methyltransferase